MMEKGRVPLALRWLGRVDYDEAHAVQRRLVGDEHESRLIGPLVGQRHGFVAGGAAGVGFHHVKGLVDDAGLHLTFDDVEHLGGGACGQAQALARAQLNSYVLKSKDVLGQAGRIVAFSRSRPRRQVTDRSRVPA